MSERQKEAVAKAAKYYVVVFSPSAYNALEAALSALAAAKEGK